MPDAAQLTMTPAKRGEGRRALIEAARLEFEELGYDGTNSNTIAKRAGFAPQTFYRHFKDKRAIFLAVYAGWVEAEADSLAHATSARAFAQAIIDHHCRHKVFRRSLRRLTVEDAEVGAARAASRLAQVKALAGVNEKFAARPLGQQVAMLLNVERLCDAIADGEFAAMGIPEAEARANAVRAIRYVVDLP
jgi:AcrR family transcriptional regulator